MERESRKPLSNNTKPILTKSVPFFCLGRIQMEYVKEVKTSSLSEKMDFHAAHSRTYAYAHTPAHKYGTVAPANSCHVVR